MEPKQKFIEDQLPLLENLKPYAGAIRKHNDPKDYIENYFAKERPATYTKDGVVQCGGGRLRSFLDIYYLTKAKFSDVTKQFVAFTMLSLAANTKKDNSLCLSPSYCSTVHKHVFYSCDYPLHYPAIGLDESGFKIIRIYTGDPIDGVTQEDIVNLANEHFNLLKQK